MARSSTQAARLLFAKALEQGGYFTAKQALQAGYGYPHLEYHEGAGNFEKVGHGLYRFNYLPRGEHDEYVRLSLWSRDRGDNPQAVVSHQSALVLHGLSDLLPNQIDLTVPRGFRKVPPQGVELHKSLLSPKDFEERNGFRVTTPMRTLLDLASGGISQVELARATYEAIRLGQVRKEKLIDRVRNDPKLNCLMEVLVKPFVAREKRR